MNGSGKNVDLLLKNFANRTRLMILTLIIKNGPMTVTQLSKIIKTSRSNLYQIIKDMLSDGVITQVKTETNRNYVEKYYYINEDLFASVGSEDLKNALMVMDDEDLRNLMVSFLATASAIFSIMAEQVAMATPGEMNIYREEIRDDLIIMSFSSLSRETMAKYAEMNESFLKEVEDSSNHSREDHFLYVVGFPSTSRLNLFRNDDSNNGKQNKNAEKR
ncbi:conserved hypothetical protein [Thermoplasma acidophilum]|uniref:HTH arsR-type domain-containing protein n=1 Tax=Thermoplasma acidophilum (strain ATCC 25905 / DSM 1728 / JCM 9062 / NBRC 15155 / AMRC-C165) TaxID=273075 RepID=Q9HLP2_THEAC|nr:winged helix-turn-helix domain-containing protein [Thermoplasma acidophilum]CAC11331.1 conserved hypothetical protein [Thermoplasma acidophilum]